MKRLTLERKQRGLNQADLAFELRIHPSIINKIENGKHKPFKPSKNKLENYFNMTIEELLEEVD